MVEFTPDPLADFLKSYCNVNAVSVDSLVRDLQNSIRPEVASEFRKQLAAAIKNQSMSPEQYETLTGEDFDSQEALIEWLEELWTHLYGDKPIEYDIGNGSSR